MAIRKDFGFIGRLSLDFAQTGDMGWGERYERLTSPSELNRWFGLSALQLPPVHITNEDLSRARALRSAIWRVADAVAKHERPRADDIRHVNAAGRRPTLGRELSGQATSLDWHRPSLAAALATIAQDAILLLGDEAQRWRLRRCENPGCRVLFYDDSRPGSRRWCAANRCGDRMRARSYRARQG
jgi:predicted RNA-binding Zn ribbon-like protein